MALMGHSRGARQTGSGLHRIDRHFGAGDRTFVLEVWADRWSDGAIAAALTYPDDYRSSVEEWVEFLDSIDVGLRLADRESSSRIRRRGR